MINKNKAYRRRVLAILSELHYCHGVNFPFSFPLTYKMLQKIDRKIQRRSMSGSSTPFNGTQKPHVPERHIGSKLPKNPHIVSIWRTR